MNNKDVVHLKQQLLEEERTRLASHNKHTSYEKLLKITSYDTKNWVSAIMINIEIPRSA